MQNKNKKNITATFAMVGVIACMSACSKPVINAARPQELGLSATEKVIMPYRIGFGDELAINFFFAPELNDVVQVRPDGRISLMFVQDVLAVGKTPAELGAEIRETISTHLKQSDVSIVVRSFASQKAYVGGEVFKPGSVPLIGTQNVLQILAEAGWITPAGRRDMVVLVRRGVDGKPGVYPIDVDKITTGEDLSQNVYVNAGDMILVPPSDITEFNRWVDQYIRQALPVTGSVVYTN